MNRIQLTLEIAFRTVLLLYKRRVSIKFNCSLSVGWEEGGKAVLNAGHTCFTNIPYVQSAILAFLLHTADLLRYSKNA